MIEYSREYTLGRELAIREFEKTAFIGAVSNIGKAIWNSPLRKGLGYLSGMGGRVGSKGSFAYKYLPSSTVGSGLGAGTIAAASAEDGNRLNSFVVGGLAGGIGFGAFRGMSTIGKRVFSPWMRRGNMARYTNMGFGDKASRTLLQKNEFGYINDMISHTGGHVGKLKNYMSTEQFKLLNPQQQKLMKKFIDEANANKGYFSDSAIKTLGKINNTYTNLGKNLVQKADGMTKFKYNLGAKTKYVGALGGGLGISTMSTPYIHTAVDATAGRVVPKTQQTPSNIYNPYYGGM